MNITAEQLAGCIDHTLLAPAATTEQIKQHCMQAKEYGFYAVSLNPRWVNFAAEFLLDSKVKIGGVVSLPFGADTTKIKVAQTKENIFTGADEIDMVADLPSIIEGNAKYLLNEFRDIKKVCHSMKPEVTLKVIIESAALTREQIIFACQIAQQAGVDYVKTSTGLHPAGGASIEAVKLMKESAPNCRIKAAGGIRTARAAIEMLEAGADRIGASASVQIIKEFKAGQIE